MSSGGTSIRFDENVELAPQTQVRLAFPMPTAGMDIPATVVSSEGSVLRVRFENLTIPEQEVLTMVLYSRADSWLGWGESRESDNVLESLGRIFQISMHGLAATFRSLFSDDEKTPRKSAVAVHCALLHLAAGGRNAPGWWSGKAQGAAIGNSRRPAEQERCPPPPTRRRPPPPTRVPPCSPGSISTTSRWPMPAAPQIELHGIDTQHNIYFTLPQTHVPTTAKIHLYYSFSPSLLPQLSHLKLILNGTLFATVQPTPGQLGGSDSRDMEAEFTIPPELLVHNNTLTIEFIGHYTMVCEDPANTTLWARVHRNSYIEFEGNQLPMADDLKQLPMPFLDPAVIQPLSIPGGLRFGAVDEGDPGGGHRHQLLRHDLRKPSGALSRCTSAPFRRVTSSWSPIARPICLRG